VFFLIITLLRVNRLVEEPLFAVICLEKS